MTNYPPQHRPEQDPRPDPTPPQDQGESSEFLEQLAGINTDSTAYIDDEDVEPLEGINMTDVYQGDTDVNQERVEGDAEQFDTLLELELRDGETDDVMEAIEEGYTYVPPIDPPIDIDRSDLEGVQVAAGTNSMAHAPDIPEGSFDTARTSQDDMTARVRHTLRANSATQHLADRLQIMTVNGTVIVRGVVDDLLDSDNIVEVIGEVPGVIAVRDETTVRGL
jgi:hypothetical protein